jgi:hypothetical protein
MTEYPHPTWELRDQMGRELLDRINSHPQKGAWQEGFPATGLMLNSASHPDGDKALEMVVEDTLSAYKRKAPTDIVKFALAQVYEFRKTLLSSQARVDEAVVGDITPEKIKNKLKSKIPQSYIKDII